MGQSPTQLKTWVDAANKGLIWCYYQPLSHASTHEVYSLKQRSTIAAAEYTIANKDLQEKPGTEDKHASTELK